MYTLIGFGDRLRSRRKELKYTQEALANKMQELGVEVETQTFKKWEVIGNQSSVGQKKSCSSYYIPALCKALDCDVEYLFGNSPTPHKEIADVAEATGLSKKAAEKLISYEKRAENDRYNYDAKMLSKMISSGTFDEFRALLIRAQECKFVIISEQRGEKIQISDSDKVFLAGFEKRNGESDLMLKNRMLIKSIKQAALEAMGDFFDYCIDNMTGIIDEEE